MQWIAKELTASRLRELTERYKWSTIFRMGKGSEDDRVNLEILRKPSGRSFLRELDAAPQLLRAKDATHFFKILLAHFVRGVDTSIGEAIFLCISRVLAMGNATETFLAGSFALALPYSLFPINFNEEDSPKVLWLNFDAQQFICQ